MAGISSQVPVMSGLPDITFSGAPSRSFATPTPVLLKTSVSTTSTPTTTPTSSASTPTNSPKPSTAPGLSSGVKAAAIAVPIVFVILLVPLIYLIIRSHQMRKANEQRNSQRSSQQAMIQQPHTGPPKNGSPEAAFRSLDGNRQRPKSQHARKPINSLGLFNFEFSTPSSPSDRKSITPKSSGPFSMVRLKSSKETVPDGGPEPSTNGTSNVKAPVETSQATSEPNSPFNPHFAPLNQIGIAQTRDGRVRPNRSPPRPSNDQSTGLDTLQASDAPHSQTQQQNHSQYPQRATSGAGYMAVDTEREPQTINRQPSAVSQAGRSSNYGSNRYSDVSAMSDEGDHRRSSNIFPGPYSSGGTQPYRIL